MNDKRYRYILYTITAVIITTIGIQLYWNYKNYQTNKQQLVNDVQISLDKAVDDYYAKLAEETTMGLSFNKISTDSLFKADGKFAQILSNIKDKKGKVKSIESIDVTDIKGVKILRGFVADSVIKKRNKNNEKLNFESVKLKLKELKQSNPVKKIDDFEMLTSKVMISIKNDTLNLKTVDSLLKQELQRKKIDVNYSLNFEIEKTTSKTVYDVAIVKTDTSHLKHKDILRTFSKSTFLPKRSNLSINFSNETKVILKRMLGGILISAILILAIISCLFYLLKIINSQKQLAEVKNDLISNITHEFKTPIATIGAALEGINNFNTINDKAKTKKYINVSSNQLTKLNIMVEKLLETATLDSESLNLSKENTDIVSLLKVICNRYQTQNETKIIKTNFNVENLVTKVDVFHFENAINNILDNAIKYGGELIKIDLSTTKTNINITISDNGTSLNKANKERIFEKFYRIPKGNQHDVKGFGIGLYYTKSIIEKHGGTINLDLKNNLTMFKIELPNG